MVLPPSKRQKAPKTAWTRCPSCFSQSLRVQQVAPTSLCKGGKKVYLFYSVRFSHFIDSLNRASQLARFLLIHYFSALLIKAFNSSFGIKPTVLSTSSPFEKITIAGML